MIVLNNRKPRGYWTIERLREEALQYGTIGEFAEKSPTAYSAAHKKNIIRIICSHMISMRSEWSNELLHQEALKYDTRGKFAKNSKKAYQVAHKKGKVFLDYICSHMKDVYTYWSDEDLLKEALKYNSMGEFNRHNPSAYCLVRVRGLHGMARKHMKMSKNSSVAEIIIFETIKKMHPDTKKIKDMTVSIPNKPHIHGFDIDVFVPELKKGIEYDGEYYHSFEYMRNDSQKALWSDNDIHNYHQLKDDWFATKDIQILHIKEEDWNVDREGCIKRCLNFLNT